MSQPLCEERISCLGTDYPVSNYSAEDPDNIMFVSLVWPGMKGIGGWGGGVPFDSGFGVDPGPHLGGYGDPPTVPGGVVVGEGPTPPAAHTNAIDNVDNPPGPGDSFSNPKPTGDAIINPPVDNGVPKGPSGIPNTPPPPRSRQPNPIPRWRPLIAPDLSGKVCAGDTALAEPVLIYGSNPPFTLVLTGVTPPGFSAIMVSDTEYSLVGTFSTPGNYTFGVRVTNTLGEVATASATIKVLGFANVPPPDGEVGTPYSFQLTAVGGTGPYTFTLVSGSLPDGLSLSSSGLISGTPTTEVV